MSTEPMILVALGDPEQKPRLYACPKCGMCHSPEIYLATYERRHQAAREAASDCYSCKTSTECADCGVTFEGKSFTHCLACRRKNTLERAEKIDAATVAECFGFDGDKFYNSADEAAEDGETWVHPATFDPYRLEADSILESMLDEHHEDASAGDLNGLDALLKAIAEFNERQTLGSWWADTKRVARVSEDAAEAAA